MRKEALQGGGGGSGAENSTRVCATDSVNPDALDALLMKGPVYRGRNVRDLVGAEPNVPVMDKLETALVKRRLRRLLGGLGGPFGRDDRPSSPRGGGARRPQWRRSSPGGLGEEGGEVGAEL